MKARMHVYKVCQARGRPKSDVFQGKEENLHLFFDLQETEHSRRQLGPPAFHSEARLGKAGDR